MIGRLRGVLAEKRPPELLLDVAGVGYELEAPMSTFYLLPETGAEVQLHVHLLVREDAQQLFGFISEAERGLFRALIRISGVGAKMALAILSGMSAEQFAECVRDGNAAALVRLPGIGKKTAERLIVEMRDRLGKAPAAAGPGAAALGGAPANPREEAVSALEALGYKAVEAEKMMASVPAEEARGMATEELIRQALRARIR